MDKWLAVPADWCGVQAFVGEELSSRNQLTFFNQRVSTFVYVFVPFIDLKINVESNHQEFIKANYS